MADSNKVLVTGGAGYIGSHTVVSLVNAGYEPVILDNYSNSKPQVISGLTDILGKDIIHYHGDCQDWELLKTIFSDHELKGVIHFAASKAVGESVENPLLYYSNNLNSLLTVLKAMDRFKVHSLVFSSSCTVYGQPDHLPVTEDTVRKPAASPYGNTKQICEDIILDVTKSPTPLKAVSLRYFNPIGAHHSARIGELPLGTPNNLIPYVAQTAAGLRENLTIFGDDYNTPDGTCIRDYIHVVDLADAHVKSLSYLDQRAVTNFYDVFNLGTGKGNTVLEVIQSFEDITGSPLNYTIGPRRSGDVEQIFASVEKASKELDWNATKTMSEALSDTWKWQLTLMKNT